MNATIQYKYVTDTIWWRYINRNGNRQILVFVNVNVQYKMLLIHLVEQITFCLHNLLAENMARWRIYTSINFVIIVSVNDYVPVRH